MSNDNGQAQVWKFPDTRIGDDVIVYTDTSRSEYFIGKATMVKSRSINVTAIVDGGIIYRVDVVHESDPRIPVLDASGYFQDGAKGIFRVADMTEEVRRIDKRQTAFDRSLQDLVMRVARLEKAASEPQSRK